MTVICNNCGSPMPDTGHRACEACRTEWRMRGRKPGGPAEQREILAELLGVAKDMTRILDAVSLHPRPIGKCQMEIIAKAKRIILTAERMLRP